MQQPPYEPQGFPYQGNYPPPPQQPSPFYQQPTMQGYPTVPPPTPKKRTVWQRYTTAKRSAKIGIGCGVLFLALCLCHVSYRCDRSRKSTEACCPSSNCNDSNTRKHACHTRCHVPTDTGTPDSCPNDQADKYSCSDRYTDTHSYPGANADSHDRSHSGSCRNASTDTTTCKDGSEWQSLGL